MSIGGRGTFHLFFQLDLFSNSTHQRQNQFVLYVQPEGCGYKRWNSPKLPDYVEDLITQLRHFRDVGQLDQRFMEHDLEFFRQKTRELEDTLTQKEEALGKQAEEIGRLKEENGKLKSKLKMFDCLILGCAFVTPLVLGFLFY